MKRTTVTLPDELAAAVARTAARRRVSISQLTRDALAQHLGVAATEPRDLPFVALGASGQHTTARDVEEILADEWDAAVVDSGSLYAAADVDDDEHQRSVDTLRRRDLELVIPTLVVAEVTYLVGRRLGSGAEAQFLAGLRDLDVEAPHADDWTRMSALVGEYADFPLGGTDASVVALAERLDTDIVITLDRRHFAAIRPLHRPALRLLPE